MVLLILWQNSFSSFICSLENIVDFLLDKVCILLVILNNLGMWRTVFPLKFRDSLSAFNSNFLVILKWRIKFYLLWEILWWHPLKVFLFYQHTDFYIFTNDKLMILIYLFVNSKYIFSSSKEGGIQNLNYV